MCVRFSGGDGVGTCIQLAISSLDNNMIFTLFLFTYFLPYDLSEFKHSYSTILWVEMTAHGEIEREIS